MNAFERYCAWNAALYHYYFNNNDQQVLLYVDDDVLEEVGKSSTSITENLNGKTYIEHFLSSTCIQIMIETTILFYIDLWRGCPAYQIMATEFAHAYLLPLCFYISFKKGIIQAIGLSKL